MSYAVCNVSTKAINITFAEGAATIPQLANARPLLVCLLTLCTEFNEFAT